LTPDDPEQIKARMDEAKKRRLETQPHGSRSAGCFFKNPPASTIGTGKMIDEMGMKGARRGTAIVSPVHANFIVTEGEDARAEDALALAEEIRERVKREHGIDLEYEVELWRATERSEEAEVPNRDEVPSTEE
jgi:UDP-N-acetylmuramate dehydrogenase